MRKRSAPRAPSGPGDRLATRAKLAHLTRGEAVQQQLAHRSDVTWRRLLERCETGIGEDGDLPAAIAGARLAPDPAPLLELAHRVRQPAP